MKRKHLFIESGRVVDDDTRIYCVMIGTGKQDTRDYLKLLAYSVEHGCFFSVYDNECASFLGKMMQRYPNIQPMVTCSAREMVKSIQTGSRPALSQSQLDTRAHALRYLSLNYRINRLA